MTLTLDVSSEDLDDPLGWCQEHDRRGSWGVGKSRLALRSEAHLEYGLGLLAQAVVIVRRRTLDADEGSSDATKQYARRHHDRYAFWTELLAFARARTDLHARISPGYETWVGTSSGVRGLNFNYIANKHEARVELYIDRGRGSGDENFAIFDQFFASRELIEAAFGDRLEWQRLDHRRACRVAWSTMSGGYETVEGRDELFECLVDRMMRLEQALRPSIASLRL